MGTTNLEVKCESCDEMVTPEGPENKILYGIAISGIFALFFGVGVGGSIGIATAGLGIAATIPLGLLGAYFGYKAGKWFAGVLDGISCPACGSYFE